MKPYVRQRVDNIMLLLPEDEWKHVNSSNNSADLLSRGMTAKAFYKSSLWNSGPSWLGNLHVLDDNAAVSCSTNSV